MKLTPLVDRPRVTSGQIYSLDTGCEIYLFIFGVKVRVYFLSIVEWLRNQMRLRTICIK